MCFGNQTTTQQTTTPQNVQNAAAQNISSAENLQNTGFQAYTGQQVANFAPQQQQSFGLGTDVANAASGNIMPGSNALSYALNSSQNAPTISAPTIASQMSPYMNAYVGEALAPQLQANANAYMLQSQAQQGAATSAGAFGDPRAALLQGNLGLNYALENQGLVGSAYTNAFNTAIGAGAQDVSNSLTAQQGNANVWNQSIQDALSGSNTANTQGTNAASLINTLGGQQTAQSQAQLNAQYNQWLMAQQYPFLTSQNLNSAISSAVPTNTTQTTSAPNNAGFGILGALLGGGGSMIGANPGTTAAGATTGGSGILGLAALSDERVKENMERVGELDDGSNVYRFNFPGDPETRIGLSAQEQQKKNPKAVTEIGGLKYLDYQRATQPSVVANDKGPKVKQQTPSFGIAA